MIATTMKTLLSHYRRHPGQLLMLLLGLWVASALWSGVQAINASARDSYARAESLFTQNLDSLTRRDGAPLSRETYIELRRSGLEVSPLLEGNVESTEGVRLSVLGIDPLTLPGDSGFASAGSGDALVAFMTPPYQTQLAPNTLEALGLAQQDVANARPRLANGHQLPPLVLTPNLPPDTLLMDIAAASRLLETNGTFTRLVARPGEISDVPEALLLTPAATLVSPGQLTESFHLNLTALALLALVVGLFIVHAALGLALEQRLGMLRTLRALGVPGRTLVGLLALELLLLGGAGALLGIVSGVWLAQALLPDVAATLGSLYGAGVAAELSLPWHYWLGGLGVTLGGLFIAGTGMLWRAGRLSVLGLGQAQAWRAGFHRQLRIMSIAGALGGLMALGLWLWLTRLPAGEGLLAGFGLVTMLLLASALCLPPLLALVLAGLARLAKKRPLAQWALADLQLQLPRLALAMMALLIALSANLGVSSMVGGFRLTFLDWLDQRLAAELYMQPTPDYFEEISDWLLARPEVAEILPTGSGETTLVEALPANGPVRTLAVPVSIFGITPGERLRAHWPLLDTLAGRDAAWAAITDGQALINEQLAIAQSIAPGDQLRLSSPTGPQTLQVVGVYPDYGNPRGEVALATSQLTKRFAAPPSSLGIALHAGANTTSLQNALVEQFGRREASTGVETLTDQQEVKRIATGIFERTFSITRALNALTLGVAALALLATLLAQSRERRRQLAPLWALGVTRSRLAGLQLSQLCAAALVTALLAVPLGIALTACLVSVINVAAFGWRLPLHLFPGEILLTVGVAVGVAALAALLPVLSLWRTPPRELLSQFETT
ncbi:ABC transporter permease [Vreelandella rituensis]|nr:ABC transporter permease [Halomonas rituensis]